MDLSKLLTERILLDTALILVLVAGVLYGFGIFFAEGVMTGYGLTSELLALGFEETMMYGFVTLIFTPIKSTYIWLLSFAGLVPLIVCLRKKNIPVIFVYFGILFFLFFQVAACYETGELIGAKEREEIAAAFEGKKAEDFDYVKAKILMNKSDNQQVIEEGYSLGVPGDYFVLVKQDKVLAIRREHIVTIEYEAK